MKKAPAPSVAVIADAIRRHRLIDYWPSELDRLQGTRLKRECDCGWTSPERDCTWTDHPEHVATFIAAAVASQSEIDDAKAQVSPNPSAEQHYQRRIETPEQLDALPDASVVLAPAACHQRIAGRWCEVHACDREQFDAPELPATLLWSPGVGE